MFSFKENLRNYNAECEKKRIELAQLNSDIAIKKQTLYKLNTQLSHAEFKKEQIINCAKDIIKGNKTNERK